MIAIFSIYRPLTIERPAREGAKKRKDNLQGSAGNRPPSRRAAADAAVRTEKFAV
jgi:hypothetical protein